MKKIFVILFSLFTATAAFANKTYDIFPGEAVNHVFFDGKTYSGKLNVLSTYPEVAEYNPSTKKIEGKKTGTTFINVLWGNEHETFIVNVVPAKLSDDGTFTISDNVTEISVRDIKDKTKIKKIVFGKGLKSIEKNIFFNLPNLEGELVIPGNVKTIGDMAFGYCPKLTSVVLEEGVESLGKAPFNCSDGIKKVTLPKSLKQAVGSLGLLYGTVDIICEEDSFAENYFKQQRYYIPSCFKVTGDTLTVKEGTVYFPENYKGKGTVKNIILPDSILPDKFDKIIPQTVKIYCNNGTDIALYCREFHSNYEIITPQSVISGVTENIQTDKLTQMALDKKNRVEPLLKTVWGQREGKLQFAENKQASNCEPLAIANLLFYHNIPLSGNHYYKTSKKEYFQDFDRFNADYTQCILDMTKRATDTQHYDSDLLLYNCAIVLNRDWLNATREYYGIENMLPDYAPVKITRNSYAWPKYDYCSKTKDEFEMIIKTNLLQKRPVMYSIHSKDGKWNHLTIIDGYRYSKFGVFEVHVDAGWDGKETKWAPLWGSFNAIDTNGLRTYDGENRLIYEFIPLTGAEKENWQPKRVTEAQKKEYTKLINTDLFYRHILAEHRDDPVVEEHLTFNEEEVTPPSGPVIIPVKEILKSKKSTLKGSVNTMTISNSKFTVSEASSGQVKTLLTLTSYGLSKDNSLEISYYKESNVLVDKFLLDLPVEPGYVIETACWEIPVQENIGLYQIRISHNGKLVSNPTMNPLYKICNLLVYDYPRISEIVVSNVSVKAKSDTVKLTVTGQGFTSVDDPKDLFLLECIKKDIVKNAKVTVTSDNVAYVEIKNPKKKGNYKITISDKNKKSKKEFTLNVNDYSTWKAGDFIYTDGTRSAEYDSNKFVAAIIFGFTDEGTPLGVSVYDSKNDLGVGLEWAKCGPKISSITDFSNGIYEHNYLEEYSFGAWNYWPDFHFEVDRTTGEWKGDADGKDNWTIIKAIDPIYSTPQKAPEYYPAFAYAQNYASYHDELKGTVFENGWYIPTMFELAMIADARDAIDAPFRKIKGSDLPTYANYTSSNTDKAIRYWDLILGQKKTHSCWKYDLSSFRAIRAF